VNALFNLVDEPWIPCVDIRHGRHQELSIREVLARSHELQEIDDPSPLVTISLYRLLLAILHRNFGPEDEEGWRKLRQRGAWDAATLNSYFGNPDRYYRFDLFGEQPFYQSASLDIAAPEPISLLAHELASGNNATLFDHTSDARAPAVSPAQAACYLVAYHGFAFGGRITGESEPGKFGPLIKGALVLVRGTSLFETLLLNLHQYSHEYEEPWSMEHDDCPAWECAEETQARSRLPRGHLDLLTWQSRRVRLIPERDDTGQIVVRFVVVRKGYWFPEDFHRRNAETMVAFSFSEKPGTGGDPYPPVLLQQDRAVWRDSHALFTPSEESRRPKMLDWLNRLANHGCLERHEIRYIDVFGLCTVPGKAKAILWRHERLPLPLVYLNDKELRDSLKQALDLANAAAGDLNESVKHLATVLRTPDLAKSLAPTRAFWTYIEADFLQYLRDATANRRAAFSAWCDAISLATRRAFIEAVRGYDTSARLLQATVTAERVLNGRLRRTIERYRPFEQGDAA